VRAYEAFTETELRYAQDETINKLARLKATRERIKVSSSIEASNRYNEMNSAIKAALTDLEIIYLEWDIREGDESSGSYIRQ
jgi:hypothetical protein